VLVGAVIHAVVRGCADDVFQKAQLVNSLGMQEELVKQIGRYTTYSGGKPSRMAGL